MARPSKVWWRLAVVVGVSILGACKADKAETAAAPSGAPPGAVVAITADEQGFHPASLKAAAGRPLRLEFKRTSDQTCATEVVFPALKIRRELPLDKPVAIDVAMPASGSIEFACGMGMFKGAIVAE
jgi:plastocyanin domain-containing protein